ncbi:Thermostable carboxypeptidase 1 [Planktothrix serta PCC 8927]|uniref:Metal-dependent carboxypeptidase n=1 Tax=Planktothrix serta PCC 8927 TaxID=671068 RepID=A0A7Z9BPJ0_9CYAN|nr:carboxypeptidase M32 [Planktothrix serta]VXD19727.1 Thermostable carboxypeptidase 1 [Planktothrix serta PCC 8927]
MSASSSPNPKFTQLLDRLTEINDIKAAISLLYWDQATYMPPGGAQARGRQMATLRRLAHEKFTDPVLGQLLEDLRTEAANLPYPSLEASLIRVTRRDYDRAVRVPSTLMAQISQHQSAAYNAWAKAREAESFAIVQPYLQTTLELSQEYADCFPGYEHIADPLIDQQDEGMTVGTVRSLFEPLRQQLVPMVEAITACTPLNDSYLYQNFSPKEQLKFSLGVIHCLGYDLKRGRQDKTLHPFMTKFSIDDVRITTRVYEHHLEQALFSTIHEAGHALYEQGINSELEGTPLAGGASSGLHESQARLWENMIGRSRGFWEWFYPRLQGVFMRQLGQVTTQQFYQAINKVTPSLIRTDADEVTYNLHIMIRFDLELAMLEGKLAISDLPEAWNERYRKDLGVIPTTDVEGVLQDVHWYIGLIGGMFQSYTLGNLIAAQIYDTVVHFDPEIPFEIERGSVKRLLEWLQQNIYQHGRKFTTQELIEQVTGSSLTIDPFLHYIRHKYEYLYQCKL